MTTALRLGSFALMLCMLVRATSSAQVAYRRSASAGSDGSSSQTGTNERQTVYGCPECSRDHVSVVSTLTDRARSTPGSLAQGINTLVSCPWTAAALELRGRSPCRSSNATIVSRIAWLKRVSAFGGIDTASISLVSNPATCKAVVDAYNAQSIPAEHLDSAYVLNQHSGYLIYLEPGEDIPAFKAAGLVTLNDSLRLVDRGVAEP